MWTDAVDASYISQHKLPQEAKLKRLIFALIATLSLAGFATTAQADTTNLPTLVSLGTISSHHPVARNCLFVPEEVANAVTIDLVYLGPDHNEYTATGSGDPAAGNLAVCPDSTGPWPSGFYWLRRVVVTGGDGTIENYVRPGASTANLKGDILINYSGLNLRDQDFCLL